MVEAKLRALARQLTDKELVMTKAPGGSGGLVASVGYLVLDPGAESDSMSRRRSTGENSMILELWGPPSSGQTQSAQPSFNLFVDDGGAALACRAAYFGDEIKVWEVDGATARRVEPSPLTPAPVLGRDAMGWESTFIACGATPVDDFGRLVGEVHGLEVGRIVVELDGSTALDVGVGQADRELYRLVHSHLDAEAGLRRAVDMVLATRVAGQPNHPLQRLARERWYRSAIVANPGLVGAERPWPVAPLRERATLGAWHPTGSGGWYGLMAVRLSWFVRLASIPTYCPKRLSTDTAPTRRRPRRRSRNEIGCPSIDALIGRLPRARFMSVPPPWGVASSATGAAGASPRPCLTA
ncbi:MAG: hypothetical protein R2706_00015 [Acidimicrobiales bacterium]